MNILEHLASLAEDAEGRAQTAANLAGQKRTELKRVEQFADRATADARGWRQLSAIVAGDGYLPHPDTVTSADDVLGLTVGVLTIGPPPDATDEQLREYVEVMRRLFDHANHQAVLATEVLRRRQEPAGTVVATSGPLATAPMPPDKGKEMVCLACGRTIRRSEAGWTHITDGTPICQSGGVVDDHERPTRWTAPNGQVWDLTAHYADHAGDTWHWAGGFGDDGGGMEPLMSRDDWRQQDVLLGKVLKVDGPLEPVRDRTVIPPAKFVRDAMSPPPDPYRPPETTTPDPAQERVDERREEAIQQFVDAVAPTEANPECPACGQVHLPWCTGWAPADREQEEQTRG